MPSPGLKMSKRQAANCPEFYLMDQDFKDVDKWWDEFKAKAGSLICADQDDYETLVKRLVLHSSLALTILPQQMSSLLKDSHLIILRFIIVAESSPRTHTISKLLKIT